MRKEPPSPGLGARAWESSGLRVWLIGSYQKKTEAGCLVLVKGLEFEIKQSTVQGQALMRGSRVTLSRLFTLSRRRARGRDGGGCHGVRVSITPGDTCEVSGQHPLWRRVNTQEKTTGQTER